MPANPITTGEHVTWDGGRSRLPSCLIELRPLRRNTRGYGKWVFLIVVAVYFIARQVIR